MSNNALSSFNAEAKTKADRRAYPRTPGPFDGSYFGSQTCRISNLSVIACYVECLAPMDKGVHVDVTIELPREGPVLLRGEIIYKEPGMGFALRFLDISPEVSRTLACAVVPTGAPVTRLM
jgi:PilZ domain